MRISLVLSTLGASVRKLLSNSLASKKQGKYLSTKSDISLAKKA